MPRARMATPFHVFCPHHTASYPARRNASTGKSASVDFSSCRQTTSGRAARSQASRFDRRLLTLLMLKVAIFIATGWESALREARGKRPPGYGGGATAKNKTAASELGCFTAWIERSEIRATCSRQQSSPQK